MARRDFLDNDDDYRNAEKNRHLQRQQARQGKQNRPTTSAPRPLVLDRSNRDDRRYRDNDRFVA